MAIRLVHKADDEPSAAEECARQLCVAGTPASVLMDRIELHSRVLLLAAEGLYVEMVKAHPQDPRRRYATIVQCETQQLRQDLGALLAALRE
jgi:hypothetical protein